MAAAPTPISGALTSATPWALVAGEDADLRAALSLLRTGGIDVAADAAPSAGAPAADGPRVVVLLAHGPDAIARARTRWPEAALVAVVPGDVGSATLRRALRAGAAGLVPADRLAATLLPTVSAVAAGMIVAPPAIRRQLAVGVLSHREKQILRLVVRGYTNRQIANELFVAESTVKTHLSSAFGKLDTRSRAETAALIMDPEEGGALGILVDPTGTEDPLGWGR